MSNILVNAPKTARRGSVVEIKALILHPMETGFRPGTQRPHHPAQHHRALHRDLERHRDLRDGDVARDRRQSRSSPSSPRRSESGTVVLRWTGDEGFAVEERVVIAVE